METFRAGPNFGCSMCTLGPSRGGWVYSCQRCNADICGRCKPADDTLVDDDTAAAAGLDAAQDAPIVAEEIAQAVAAGNEVASVPDEITPLLRKLRLLPEAFPKPPMLWIPRRMKQQIGVVFRNRVAEATRTANAPLGDHDAEIAHRLCKVAPQLLLRQVAGGDLQSDRDPSDASGYKLVGAIRDRARLAVCQEWEALVDALLHDLQVSRDTHVAPSVIGRGSRDEHGRLTSAAAQTATVKARTGSLRGSSAVLIGGPPVPPSPEADASVQSLFHTEPLSLAEHARLEEALAAAAAIPARKRLRVTLRQVGCQASVMKPAAGPGPSGWRN